MRDTEGLVIGIRTQEKEFQFINPLFDQDGHLQPEIPTYLPLEIDNFTPTPSDSIGWVMKVRRTIPGMCVKKAGDYVKRSRCVLIYRNEFDWTQTLFLEGLHISDRKPSARLQEDELKPREITDTLIWHVEQKIRDELDVKLKAVPSHTEVFVRYCRDKMNLKDMEKNYPWKYRTLKARKAALECFLQQNFQLTLAAFFVDRSIFAAAERQLKEPRARHISPRCLGEFDTDWDAE